MMTSLIRFFMQKSSFVTLLTFIVLVGGSIASWFMQRESLPDVQMRNVNIETIFPGAAANEIETLITNRIEQALLEVDGIERIRSSSSANRSLVIAEINVRHTSVRQAEQDIQRAIEQIPDFPPEAEDPVVSARDTRLMPVIEVVLSSDQDQLQLRDIAKQFQDDLERLPDIGRVHDSGLQDKEIGVRVDPDLLAETLLSLEEVIQAIRQQNQAIPAGTVLTGPNSSLEYEVRTYGRLWTPDDVANVVVTANELGEVIRVRDLAEVSYRLEDPMVIQRINGKPAIGLVVMKNDTADTIHVARAVRQEVEKFKETISPDISIRFLNDRSEDIERRLSALMWNFVMGLLLIVLILPLVLPPRYVLLVVIGQPLAFLGAMLVLYFGNFSLNLISMVGLIIVLGIVFDDAIVVTENIARLHKEGKSRKESALEGTRRLAKPICAAVGTTIAAFLPLAFIPDVMGEFIRPIPVTVTVVLIISLLTTLLIFPSYAYNWILPKQQTPGKTRSRWQDLLGPITHFPAKTQAVWDRILVPKYLTSLQIMIRHRYLALCAGLSIVGAAVYLLLGPMQISMFPAVGVDEFRIQTEAPVGTSLEAHATLLTEIEQLVAKLPEEELLAFVSSIGLQQERPADPEAAYGSQFAQVTVHLTPFNQRSRDAQAILADLRARIGHPEGFENINYRIRSPGPPPGRALEISVLGHEYDMILAGVDKLKKIISEVPGIQDLDDSFVQGKEELRVKLLEGEAQITGVNIESIGNSVRASFEGVIASSVVDLNEEIDIRVMLNRQARVSIESLQQIRVPNQRGDLIHLSQVTEIEKIQEIGIYEHFDLQRRVRVSADVDTGVISSLEANQKIRERLPDLADAFPGLNFHFGGEDEETRENIIYMTIAALIAISLIFLILVLSFDGFGKAMLIISALPFSIAAVVFAFFLHGLDISFIGLLGLIAILGVAANETVVFLDFMLEKRKNGMDNASSILEAARLRIRAIFLTAATTAAGVMPTAYGLAGSEPFLTPITIAKAWGVLGGSFLIVHFFPVLIAVADDAKLFFQGFISWQKKIKGQ